MALQPSGPGLSFSYGADQVFTRLHTGQTPDIPAYIATPYGDVLSINRRTIGHHPHPTPTPGIVVGVGGHIVVAVRPAGSGAIVVPRPPAQHTGSAATCPYSRVDNATATVYVMADNAAGTITMLMTFRTPGPSSSNHPAICPSQ